MRCLIGSQCNFLSSIGACDMFKFWCICNDTSQNLLNALYFVQVCLRNAIVEWIAIIKLFAGDEWIDIFARKIALANVRGVRESHSPCAGEWTKWLHWLLNALSAATNWWRPALCAFVLWNKNKRTECDPSQFELFSLNIFLLFKFFYIIYFFQFFIDFFTFSR